MKILSYFKTNYIKIILGILIVGLCFRGVKGLWVDFKENIFQSELKDKGVSLEIEERLVVKELEVASEESEKAVEEVKKVDYQTYKYAKAKQKGITITDADVKHIKSADSLLSKWRKR